MKLRELTVIKGKMAWVEYSQLPAKKEKIEWEKAPAGKPHVSTNSQYKKTWGSLGHELDEDLERECAYYPRAGCEKCKIEWPNQQCQYAHILVDTSIKRSYDGWKYQPKSERKREKIEFDEMTMKEFIEFVRQRRESNEEGDNL